MYKLTAALLITLSACLYSQDNTNNIKQQAYKIPFSSSGNIVDLAVVNTSKSQIRDVKVSAIDIPEWIKMNLKEIKISQLKENEEKEVEFSFNVEKSAPVGEETALKFMVASSAGEKWTKEIRISISAPDNYELQQNFPNPFNPSTTISYQLPEQSRISLKIYNVIGEEAAVILDDIQEAGHYSLLWNAQHLSSGMYICQLIAKGASGKQFIQRKKMSLIK